MRVVGYFNSFYDVGNLSDLDVSALTHINYAFLLLREDGSVYFLNESKVKETVDFCHSNGIKIFVSVGGWCDEQNRPLYVAFEKICSSRIYTSTFINNIIKVVKNYDFDGVDLDWEYPKNEQKIQYEFIVARLCTLLHQLDKEMSIAIYHSIADEEKYDRICAVTNYVIANLDFVNIMTYDCHEEKNHSSLKLAQKCVNYWVNTREINKDKLLIGIAFYAKPSRTPYALLVQNSPKNANSDFCGTDSYNGLRTVKRKVKYAKENCGGVCIWAINYDAIGQYSLLTTIKNAKK